MIYLKLFFSFFQVGLFSVGGGYAAIPLIQSQSVDVNGWLTMSEFTDLVTIAEMTPGPISINSATFVGIRVAGIPGAIAATIGCIFPACFIVSLLAFIYRKYGGAPSVNTVLGCLRPTVVALITSAGLAMLQTALFEGGVLGLSTTQWVSVVLFLAAFVILRRWKWNPIMVMCLCGAGNLLFSLATGAIPLQNSLG